MLFPTGTFAIFFLIVLPLSWLLMPWVHRWRPFMILASFVFYGWWDWRFVFLLAGSIAWNQLMALRIHHAGGVAARRKTLLWLAIGGNLALLGLLQVLRLLHQLDAEPARPGRARHPPGRPLDVILPVGISFYTFKGISYVVDVYRGDSEPTTLEKFAVYLSFFPHLVAGPIVRPSELIPQFDTPRDPRRVDTSRAFYLIAVGLFKKVVIANYLASNIVDEVFGAPSQHSSLEILIGGLRLRGADLLRLLRLHGHRDRDRAPARLQLPAELRLALRGHVVAGLLAALAHDALALAARLPLHPARRQPRRRGDHVPQPDADDAARRALARRRVDVRRLGRDPRGRALRGAVVARAARHEARESLTRWDFYWRRLATFHVVCFAWIFFRSDTFEVAWQMITGLFTRWGEASPLVTGRVLLAIAVGIGSQYLPPRVPRAIRPASRA